MTTPIWFKKKDDEAEIDVPELIATCIVAVIILTGFAIILYGCCTTPSQRCKCRCKQRANDT